MKHLRIYLVGLTVTALLLGNVTAQTEPKMPGVSPIQARNGAFELETRVAQLEVERIGLLSKWMPDSKVVVASNRELNALRQQLAKARPHNPAASTQVRRKAIQEKIAQLEIVRDYLASQNADKTLDSERAYVANYLSVLRKTLAPPSFQLEISQRV